jgi:hypothetical protein
MTGPIRGTYVTHGRASAQRRVACIACAMSLQVTLTTLSLFPRMLLAENVITPDEARGRRRTAVVPLLACPPRRLLAGPACRFPDYAMLCYAMLCYTMLCCPTRARPRPRSRAAVLRQS